MESNRFDRHPWSTNARRRARRLAPSLWPTLLVLGLLIPASSFAQEATAPIQFRVSLDPALGATPVSGRLLVYMTVSEKPLDVIAPGSGAEVRNVWVVAREVAGLAPDAEIVLGMGDASFPQPLANAPAGDYQVMALLDTDFNAAYTPRSQNDLRSRVVRLPGLNPAAAPPTRLRLSERVETPPLELPSGTERVEFISPALSRFWGRPMAMRGIVVLPPGYEKTRERYPTVYMTHGFTANLASLAPLAGFIRKDMADGGAPPMIWVLLDQSCPGGTHEFADSVNNGPWGTALTRELIPHLERTYRMDAKPSGRLLTGHSSGGWATLWLQVAYPGVFGGVWSTSPDPVDFRAFSNVDLTRHTNAYVRPDRTRTPIVRVAGREVESFEEFARQEAVLGAYGGQMSSFDWVFSPRGPDGRPMPLFDRATGAVDQEVARHWLEHYDISRLLARHAGTLVKTLRGKIRIIVGTADNFYLDESVRRLDETITPLGYEPKITYLANRTHFDLFEGGLITRIITQMYDVARPRHKWRSTASVEPSSELVK